MRNKDSKTKTNKTKNCSDLKGSNKSGVTVYNISDAYDNDRYIFNWKIQLRFRIDNPVTACCNKIRVSFTIISLKRFSDAVML